MKRIAISLMTIALVSLMVTGATRSYFSDNSTNLTGITFSTGNADLRISQGCMNSWYDGTVSLATFNNGIGDWCAFSLDQSNWYPGKEVDNILYLGNWSTSDIALTPAFKLNNYSGDNNLKNVMLMKVWWSGSATGTDWHPLSYYLSSSSTLPSIAHPTAQPPSPGNGGVLGLNIQVKMDPNAGNGYQNESATFDLHFDATQTH